MFEIEEDGPYTKTFMLVVRNFFEVVRNLLAVSTLKYLAVKAQDPYLAFFSILGNIGIGALIAGYFLNIHFKRSLFAENTQAQIFRAIISLLAIAPISLGISILTGHIVTVVSKAQVFN